MEQRNLKEHVIVLSIPEFYAHQPYLLEMRAQAPRVFSTFIDESVVMINQIMFTFYKNYVFTVDVMTTETWFWTTTNFMLSNRTLKYDYNDSLPIMIVCEFVLRIVALFKILMTFGFISIINALIIRLTIKCSIVVMFWYLALEEHCMRNGINYNHRSHIYRQIGVQGAQAAYFDRNRMSKFGISFSLMTALLVYYSLFMACNQVWTVLGFNSTYSALVNEQYFFYTNLIELVTFLFIRTRSSIKYFAKLITILNVTYLMYISSYPYPAQYESLRVLTTTSTLVAFYFIWKFERRALLQWNPFGSYTPSSFNPRCAYHLVLGNSEYSMGFDLMSMF